MENFQNILLPWFAWLVLAVLALAMVMWVWRVGLFMLNENEAWRPGETLGLPKGAIRTVIVISFSAIMFLIFFGNFPGIPADDRKWFLTAYASVLSFYFGTKFFEGRAESSRKPGLAISSIAPAIGTRPTGNSQSAKIIIRGSGFDSPAAVRVTNGAQTLKTDSLVADSEEQLTTIVELAPTTAEGPYDVVVELVNGSRMVYKSGFIVKTGPSTSPAVPKPEVDGVADKA